LKIGSTESLNTWYIHGRKLTGYEDVFDIPKEALEERADTAVYHYYPSSEQVRAWLGQAGLAIENEGTGNWYQHFLVSKEATHTISDS
jgi:hypothetical protein